MTEADETGSQERKTVDEEEGHNRPYITQRVTVKTFHAGGPYTGVVVALGVLRKMVCTIKLDHQDRPVDNVLYYPAKPPENADLPAAHWVICWPEEVTP